MRARDLGAFNLSIQQESDRVLTDWSSVAGVRMQASMFNVRVPLDGRDDVFLMNTFTDAQLIVSRDVVDLLDRVEGFEPATETERETIEQLAANGFVVSNRAKEREDLKSFFREVREGTETLKITVLTTLQCNFACDYCIQ